MRQPWRFFAFFLFALLLFFLFAPASFAERTLRVGIYENKPKVFTAASGKPEGVFVDLLEYIAKKEGWTLAYVPGTWKEGLARLASGEIDLMPDVAYNSEREKLFAFHEEPVVSDWFQLFARHESGVKSVVDLANKRVAVLEGSIQQEAFNRHAQAFDLNVKLVPFPVFIEAFQAVKAGSADAVIANRFNGPLLMKEYGLQDTAVVFSPTRVFFAAPLTGDRKILNALDRNLALLKKDPESAYYDALRRWTSEEQPEAVIPQWVVISGSMALLLSFAGLFGMWALKRLVNARTQELRVTVEALEQAGREWKATFESIQDAVWVLDTDGRIVHANRATERIFGKSPEEVLGRHCWEIAHGANEALAQCPMKASALGQHGRTATIHREGRWLQISVDPILDQAGAPRGYIHLCSDVTETREIEEELEQHRLGLENLVHQRTRELEAANEDLLRAKTAAESADRLKSAFLATMSHELRTPLNSIIGFTGILLQGLAGTLNDEQAKQLRMVQGSSRHLLALINDVLDISKIEAGRIELVHEPFDLHASVVRVVQTVTPTANQKGLQLTSEIEEGASEVVGDRRRVEQILMNLLSNAVKFTVRGSVSVTCRHEGSDAAITVRDTGIGISEEDLARLFRPFQQIDSGQTREYDGTGLGLHISKRLGELMGGSISVESKPGEGSAFTFRLPTREEGKS